VTKNNGNPEPDPSEQLDPLSATGMFLRAFGSETEPSQEPAAQAQPAPRKEAAQWDWTAGQAAAASQGAPQTPPPAVAPAGPKPGEFTQFFQVSPAQRSQPAPPPAVTVKPVAPPPPPTVLVTPPAPPPPPASSQSGPSLAPLWTGEFTSVFAQTPAARPAEQVSPPRVPTDPQQSPISVSSPAKSKGFSSPGISGSASAEGSFTKYFSGNPAASSSSSAPRQGMPIPVQANPVQSSPIQPSPAAPHQPAYKAPEPAVQTFKPTPAPLPPTEEFNWKREPEIPKPAPPAVRPPSSMSVTGLMDALSATGPVKPVRPAQGSSPSIAPSSEPLPAFAPAPPPLPQASASAPQGEKEGVTRLLQKLSDAQRLPQTAESTLDPVFDAAPPTAAPVQMSGLAPGPEPGEFTRLISAPTGNRPMGAAAPPAPAPPPAPLPAFAPAFAAPAPVAMPVAPAQPPVPAPKLAAPAFAAPPVPAPKFEAPKFVAPKVAAPKSALEGMVPILLIINTFLLVVLLLVVIFSLKSR